MKKGFTLIEIIVVIVLLTVIGTGSTIAVIKVQDKKTEDLLVKNARKLENALDVYLANHNEVINNINNNSEGAIVSLELLKNEGLISEELGNNKEYFILSKALLSNSKPTEEDCENGLELETIRSWVKGEDSSKVLYFCHKKIGGAGDITIPVINPDKTDDEIDDDSEGTDTEPVPDEDGDGLVVTPIITEPRLACGNGWLSSNSLACKIINNAVENSNKIVGESSRFSESQTKTIYLDTPYTTIGKAALKHKEKHGASTEIAKITNDNTTSWDKITVLRFYASVTLDESTGTYAFPEDYVEVNYKEIAEALPCDECTLDLEMLKTKCYDYAITEDCMKLQSINESLSITRPKANEIKERTKNRPYVVYEYDNYPYYQERSYYIGNGGLNISQYRTSYEIEGKKLETTVYKEKSLIKTEDDYGTSYYFRGDVKDNYVTFNNMCWRIIRVQGDGSVKLLLASKDGPCNNSNLSDNSGLIGDGTWGRIKNNNNGSCSGTYNGSVACDNPDYKHGPMHYAFFSWLDKKNFNKNLLKKETFCLGQAENEYDINFNRIKKGDYSLKCDNESSIFDRTTKSEEISAITVDELYFSGASEYLDATYAKDNANKEWYTLSPGWDWFSYMVYPKNDGSSKLRLSYSYKGTGIVFKDDEYSDMVANYRPVIVLKPNVIISTENDGDGTLEKPYIIN